MIAPPRVLQETLAVSPELQIAPHPVRLSGQWATQPARTTTLS